MELQDYLDSRGETPLEFARRAGLNRVTVGNVAAKAVHCRVDIAAKIIAATRAEPAPDGGTVTFEDLLRPGR